MALDGSTPKLVKTGRVLVDEWHEKAGNLGFLEDGAVTRMAEGMRARFDEND
jgi:hypothetical protein